MKNEMNWIDKRIKELSSQLGLDTLKIEKIKKEAVKIQTRINSSKERIDELNYMKNSYKKSD